MAEQQLNSLGRFRKQPGKLVLEEHGSCEVPAGCGGVVLRWRRPGAPIGISLFSYVAGTSQGPFLDGRRFDEQRMMVEPGEHVLSFIVRLARTTG